MTPFPQLVVNSEQTHFLLRINVATFARRALVASPLILRQVAGFFEVVACHLGGFGGDAACGGAAASSCAPRGVVCPHLGRLRRPFFGSFGVVFELRTKVLPTAPYGCMFVFIFTPVGLRPGLARGRCLRGCVGLAVERLGNI